MIEYAIISISFKNYTDYVGILNSYGKEGWIFSIIIKTYFDDPMIGYTTHDFLCYNIKPNSSSNRKTVIDWIEEQRKKRKKELPSKISQALTYNQSLGDRSTYKPFTYMDEISKESFMRCRNVGIETWIKFCKLRNINP